MQARASCYEESWDLDCLSEISSIIYIVVNISKHIGAFHEKYGVYVGFELCNRL